MRLSAAVPAGTPTPDPDCALEDRIGRFATIWGRAIFPVTATSLTRPEFERHLVPLTRTLVDALHARPFDAAVAQRVGADLVAVHCTDPEALAGTLGVVESYLVLYCGPDGSDAEGTESTAPAAPASSTASRRDSPRPCASAPWASRRR
ncbi:hypothetical protein GCM10020254_16400 [Streptomyces goshikiensis]